MSSRNKNILIIQGHPDPDGNHLCHALAKAYQEGAVLAGHRVDLANPAICNFPFIRSKDDFDNSSLPTELKPDQEALLRADHIVIIFPLWLGTLPALLKAYLEQLLRPGVALDVSGPGMPKSPLKGKSARIIVTMGMPAFFYRWFFGAHGVKNLQRNILGFCGVKPVRSTLIGMAEGQENEFYATWLKKLRALGIRAY